MSPEQLDALAAIAADLRIAFNRLSAAALTWEPAECPAHWQPPRRRHR